MLSYVKSKDFPLHLMAYWWMFWLAASYSDLNDFIAPSVETFAQFALLILSFLLGHWMVKHRKGLGFGSSSKRIEPFCASVRMRTTLPASALVCAALLLLSSWLSGALSTDFVEYFVRRRLEEGGLESLTGIRTLDILTKILAFPLSYTVILIVLANDVGRFKLTLALCIFNFLAFAYLWQVNYPLIHLFWILTFHALLKAHRKGTFDRRPMFVLLVLFAGLLASAANRFGGDLLGGLQRYIVGYHLIGFSYYDQQYLNPASILHSHSLGRSSLGFLDQMLEAVLKLFDVRYRAASFENAEFNEQPIDIGVDEFREFNAFGTLLFGLFRDFHVLGIIAGGFAYGAMATHALYRSARSWTCGAIFTLLAVTWMMGMMVDPVEEAYFWFVIIALGAFRLLNRNVFGRAARKKAPSRLQVAPSRGPPPRRMRLP